MRSSFGNNMKTIALALLLGSALLVLVYLAVVMGSAIFDNLRIRASDPMKMQPVFFVPNFMGVGSFMTTGWAFVSGILGLGLLLLSCSIHLRWSSAKAAVHANKPSAYKDGTSNGG